MLFVTIATIIMTLEESLKRRNRRGRINGVVLDFFFVSEAKEDELCMKSYTLVCTYLAGHLVVFGVGP